MRRARLASLLVVVAGRRSRLREGPIIRLGPGTGCNMGTGVAVGEGVRLRRPFTPEVIASGVFALLERQATARARQRKLLELEQLGRAALAWGSWVGSLALDACLEWRVGWSPGRLPVSGAVRGWGRGDQAMAAVR